jgi:hypothetical protein
MKSFVLGQSQLVLLLIQPDALVFKSLENLRAVVCEEQLFW